jgi:hypothetical protein
MIALWIEYVELTTALIVLLAASEVLKKSHFSSQFVVNRIQRVRLEKLWVSTGRFGRGSK